MLLPVLAIGVTCAYVIFNKNAYQSYGEKYETKSITITTTELSNTYYLQGQTITWYLTDSYYGSRSNKYGFSDISLDLNNLLNTDNVIYNAFEFYTSSSSFMIFYDTNNTEYRLENYKSKFTTFAYTIDLTTYSRKIVSTSYGDFVVSIYQPAPLSNVFYYSIDKVEESTLFSWSFNSFLAQPFEYITDVFSIPHGNIIVFFASYWLAISIIWLCFDLVMYVPNLVHKWLDKGSIS